MRPDGKINDATVGAPPEQEAPWTGFFSVGHFVHCCVIRVKTVPGT
jgi:hypothetical protein